MNGLLTKVEDSPDPYVWELTDKIDVAIEKLEEVKSACTSRRT